MTVEVVGHSDSIPPQPGSAWDDNWRLAFNRAHAAVGHLRTHAEAGTINWLASAMGELNPPFSNDTEEDRSRNRTVVLYITPSAARR